MDITFSIKYRAEWGQRLCVCGSIVELGNWSEANAVELTATSDDCWTGQVAIDGRRKDIAYYYLVKDREGQVIRREWKRMHRLVIKEPFRTIYMDDHWINRPPNSPFYSSAYYDVLFRHQEQIDHTVSRVRGGEKIVLQIYAPTVPSSKRLYLMGNTPKLGHWQTDKAVEMLYMGKGEWYVSIEIDRVGLAGLTDVEFKFFIADVHRKGIRWEAGANHHFVLPHEGLYDAIYVAGMTFDEGAYAPHAAGLVAPLFSLRHQGDYGVGDFESLRQCVDWAVTASLHVVQLLPINDTTFYRDWRDSYPYNAISVDAIHPIYMDLSTLPRLKSAELEVGFKARAEALHLSPELNYPEVMNLKEEYLMAHYRDYGAGVMKKKSFQTFVKVNETWLYPYALYSLLRDLNPGIKPQDWEGYNTYDRCALVSLAEETENSERINYYMYIQYLLSQQLQAVRAYAEERGVLLKGDLPIGVAPHSIDTWLQPELFHLDRSAGAPPDSFATDGQNWGFPTYNWNEMYRNGMQWWRNRFERMSSYFKAFRIDHILGFFRIWEIPRHQTSGLLGHFAPARPLSRAYWLSQFAELGEELLFYPTIHADEVEEMLGVELERLVQTKLLLPTHDSRVYRLEYTSQSYYRILDPDQMPGGRDTIHALVELCKEVALVEDLSHIGHYHPRISFELTRAFSHWHEPMQRKWRQVSQHYYYEEHNQLWKETALKRILPLLESTDMLVCAEDLGMIPATVPEVLNQLQILSLELERMPKSERPTGLADLSQLPYMAICTTSTHDMPPLRAWWTSLTLAEQELYLAEQLPYTNLTPHSSIADICAAIIAAHIASPSMFVILPLQDWMSIEHKLHLQAPHEEQINNPANPHQHWAWRMPLPLEELMAQHSSLSARIKAMLLPEHRD